MLVTVEVTMSVVLLITSGLLMRAVWRVRRSTRIRAANVLTLKTALPRPKYDSPVRRGQYLRAGSRGSARAAGRAECGVHQRPADGHDRLDHRRRGPRPGSAEPPSRRREPPLGDAAVFQDDGHSPAPRP